jgi:uncharacterized protein (TIGR03437 family)
MKKFALSLVLSSFGLLADTAEVAYFKAIMTPEKEVPAVTGLNASGSALIRASVIRNDAGRIVSGSVDFIINYTFPGATTFVGLHIHDGNSTVAGPVRINTGLTAGNNIQDATGASGPIERQAQVLPADANGLATLEGMFRDPSQHYVNLHTTVHQGGAIRGELVRAEHVVLMGFMNGANEVPPITNAEASATGVAQVQAWVTRDPNTFAVNSATVLFDVDYTFPGQTTFQGLHIHNNVAGVNGPVRIDTGIAAGARAVQSTESGVGNIRRVVEMTTFIPDALVVFDNLFYNPQAAYINLHTPLNPGGAIRAQLRKTDKMVFPVSMTTAKEVPAVTDIVASADAVVQVNTVRAASGDVAAAVVTFNVNHRLPGAAEFIGLHIHDGVATATGPVRVDSGISGANPVPTATGFGNIHISRIFSAGNALATINSLVRNPENHYLNLHTRTHPGGVVRSQLVSENTNLPRVFDVISAVSDPSLRTAGNGALMTVFGRDLFKVPANLDGVLAASAPATLNGTGVTIGGRNAPIMLMGRDNPGSTDGWMVIQTPYDAPAGSHPLVVTNSNGAGPAFNVNVAPAAPGIFFDGEGGIVFNLASATSLAGARLVRGSSPATAGNILAILTTGLGATTPALQTGAFVPDDGIFATPGVQVTLGGRTITPLASVAVPGFFGLSAVVFTVPTGLTPGNAQLSVSQGGAASNTVTIALR